MNLTEAQQKILDTVCEMCADGWPVTVREVQAKLGYASTQTVHRHLTDLEILGYLETKPSRRGGWRPVAR